MMMSTGSLTFGLLADIHLEPAYSSNLTDYSWCLQRKGKEFNISTEEAHFGRYGCNPDEVLVEAMFEKMRSEYGGNLDVILVLGDMVGHNYADELDPEKPNPHADYDDLLEILETLGFLLRDYFPESITLPVIGNNDCKYHYMPEFGHTKAAYYDMLFKQYFLDHPVNAHLSNLDEIERTLKEGGWYRVDLGDDLSVLVLNTLYYNSAYFFEEAMDEAAT